MSLAVYDTKRMALVLQNSHQRSVLCGTAKYDFDPDLGNVLRICAETESLSAPCAPEFVLQENSWEGAIEPDQRFGCDYSVELFVS